MKKLLPLILCLCLLLCACAGEAATPSSAFTKEIERLSVCPGGREGDTFYYTDPAKIAVFTAYIDDLYANAADLSEEDTTGDGELYIFTFSYADGSKGTFYFNGDAFYTLGVLAQGMSDSQRQELARLLEQTEPDIPAGQN